MNVWVFERFGTKLVLVVAARGVSGAKKVAEGECPGPWSAITELSATCEGRERVLYSTDGGAPTRGPAGC